MLERLKWVLNIMMKGCYVIRRVGLRGLGYQKYLLILYWLVSWCCIYVVWYTLHTLQYLNNISGVHCADYQVYRIYKLINSILITSQIKIAFYRYTECYGTLSIISVRYNLQPLKTKYCLMLKSNGIKEKKHI